jgi:hypothetical protein
MLEQSGDGAEMAMQRVVAGCLLAISTRRRNPELSRDICDETLGEARAIAAQRPGILSLPCSWALLHKSHRIPEDVREAIRLAEQALDESGRGIAARSAYLNALAHHILAQAHFARGDATAALEHQGLAVEKMPKYQLFYRGEVERAFVSQLLAQSDPESSREARQFLKSAVTWREEEELLPLEQIHTADARMNLAAHLIEYRDRESDQDLEASEELLFHEAHFPAIKTREPDDLFRTRWIELLIRLYDAWERPDERAKWEQYQFNQPPSVSSRFRREPDANAFRLIV